MNPATHFLASWCIANTVDVSPRERLLITLGGVIPDLDGLGAVAYLATKDGSAPSTLYHDWHHILCHNVLAGVVFAAIAACLATRRFVTAAMVFLTFHIHILCDVLGSRGPDGYQWPIPYFLPFTRHPELSWSGQWQLASWQNMVITLVLIGLAFWLARRRGFSFFESFWTKGDQALVTALRHRFPLAGEEQP